MSDAEVDATSVVDRSDRAKLRFTGPQALWFLDQLLTNKLDDLPNGRASDALLLTPKGRVSAAVRITNVGDAVFLDSEAEGRELLLDFFRERVFATRVEIEDVSSDYSLFSVFGGDFINHLQNALHRMDSPGPGETHRFAAGHLIGVSVPPQIDLLVNPQESERVLSSLLTSAEFVDQGVWDAYRTVYGLPLFGIDYDETFLPQEAAREIAVHFAKGCYLGQEAVAMTQRGRIRRRLMHLRFEDEAFTGEILSEGQHVGNVTSAAANFGIGAVATSVAPGSAVEVVSGSLGAAAVVDELPGTDHGPEVPSARALRESLQQGATKT